MRSQDRERSVQWQDPTLLKDAAKKMSGMQRLQAIMDGRAPKAPMAILVGIELSEVQPGKVVFTGQPQEFHYNLAGVVHGAFACTMLDSALGCAVTSLLPAGQSCTTLDLQVRFIRPLTTHTGMLRCEANVLHLGNTIGTAQASITDSAGRLYAHATTACAILREEA